MQPNYLTEISHKIASIPCLIAVRRFKKISPDIAADNPYDYYGYCDIDYDVLTADGKPAGAWLLNKITPNEADEILYAIRRKMED